MGMSQFNTALWGGTAAGMVTVTARTLIYGALRLLGVLRPGQMPNLDSYNDGLAWLNDLLDSWATERLMVKIIARNEVAMTGATDYTALPHRIEASGYTYSGGSTETKVEMIEVSGRQAITQKVLVGWPTRLYVEYSVPEATLYPWPQPADGTLYLYQWSPLVAFDDFDTVYQLPAGYALALRYCLADQLAPAFLIIQKIPQALLGEIARKAGEYKGLVKSLNIGLKPPLQIDNPFRPTLGYDIYTGELR